MGKITQSPKFDEIQGGWDVAKRWVTTFADDTKNQVNGNLSFQDNFNCSIIECTFTLANVTYQFEHGLRRVPLGWIPISIDRAGSIYKDSASGNNTGEIIRLLSDSAGMVAKILVF
jgi:hypothetical protein